MKNLIIAIAIMLTGSLASYAQNTRVKPSITAITVSDSQDPKNLGSGDGAPPTPGHPRISITVSDSQDPKNLGSGDGAPPTPPSH